MQKVIYYILLILLSFSCKAEKDNNILIYENGLHLQEKGDYTSALEQYKKAYNAFEGNEKLQNDVYFQIGRLYFELGEYNLAGKVYKSLLIIAKQANDKALEIKALRVNAQFELAKKTPDAALALAMLDRIETKLGGNIGIDDIGLMIYAYALEGNQAKVEGLVRKVDTMQLSTEEAENILLRKAQAYQLLGKEHAAQQAFNGYIALKNRDQILSTKLSAFNAHNSLLRNRIQEKSQYIKKIRIIFIIIFIIMILSFIALNNYLRSKKLQLENKLLEECIENEELLRVAKDLENRVNILEKSNKKGFKIDVLERLCEQYYIYEGTDNLQPKIIKEVKAIIEELREGTNKLEATIDENYDGLVSKLRKNAPFLKEDDIKLYCYLALGFSSTTISALIQKDKSVVYNRISRLKSKISLSGIEDKDKYLKYLEK